MQNWTVSDWAAIAGGVVFVLSLVAGAAWWMSALYFRVKDIADDLHGMAHKVRRHDSDLSRLFAKLNVRRNPWPVDDEQSGEANSGE